MLRLAVNLFQLLLQSYRKLKDGFLFLELFSFVQLAKETETVQVAEMAKETVTEMVRETEPVA